MALIFWTFPLPFLQPKISFPILPTDEMAGRRIATYIQAQQVEAFRQTSGRLPDMLRETGEPIPGMTYERLDARTYRLSGATERTSVHWVSTDSLSALLGDSTELPGVAAMRRARGGFTLVEMVFVAAVVSIVARIALPSFPESVIRTRAISALGDVDVVRTAAANYHARSNLWPSETPPGVVPPELVADLPEGFAFERGEYQLDWEQWSLPDGIPPHTGAKTLIGVSIITTDDLLGNAVAALIGNNGWYSMGNSYTFLVEDL